MLTDVVVFAIMLCLLTVLQLLYTMEHCTSAPRSCLLACCCCLLLPYASLARMAIGRLS